MRRSLGVALVAVAAAMWGLDAWIRQPLAGSTPAPTIVFGEHVVLVALTLPFLVGAFAALLRLGWRARDRGLRDRRRLVRGRDDPLHRRRSSARDFVTPVVLQKVQPCSPCSPRGVILGERPRAALRLLPRARARRRVADRRPAPAASRPRTACGRRSTRSAPRCSGRSAPCSAATSRATCASSTSRRCASRSACRRARSRCSCSARRRSRRGTTRARSRCSRSSPASSRSASTTTGCASTPAVAATLAELAFPVSAILVGYFKFGQTLTGWQWVGVARRAWSSRCCRRARATRSTSCPPPRPRPRNARHGLRRRPARRTAERARDARARGPRRARLAARRGGRAARSRPSRSCATTACRRWPAPRRSSRPRSAGAPSCPGSC